MLGPHVDPDAWAPLDRSDLNSAIFDVQARAEQVGIVLRQRDPHGFRQVAGTPAEILIASRRAAPAAHHPESFDRRERANQHGGRRPFRLRDDVHQPMNAVVEIDVGVPGLTIHRCVSTCGPWRSVTGRIVFPDVRLDFNDGAAGADASSLVNEHLAKQIARDVESRTVVERSR